MPFTVSDQEAGLSGFDVWLEGIGAGSVTLALVAALLLGLRHATEPDHLTAVAALVLGESRQSSGERQSSPASLRQAGARHASFLGFSWGIGHALAFLILGLPVVLLRLEIPQAVQGGAEVLIGLLIVFLAVRLIYRWLQGDFHAHGRTHPRPADRQPVRDTHPHFYGQRLESRYRKAEGRYSVEKPGRSPLAAFGIGAVHGVGGSAAAGVFIVTATPAAGEAMLALAVFAGATALSMAAVSGLAGSALVRRPVSNRIERLVPTLGAASLAFGAWYALAAAASLL